jgi:predicted DNA-binding transcriptional regulator AlpA
MDSTSKTAVDELLDIKAACRFLGGTKPIDPSTFWRGIRDGRFSKPLRIGPNIRRWRQSDLSRDIGLVPGDAREVAGEKPSG